MAYERRKDYSGKGPLTLVPGALEALKKSRQDLRETYQKSNKRNVGTLKSFPPSVNSLNSYWLGGPQDVF